MSKWTEVTDLSEIRQLAGLLLKNIRNGTRADGIRRIGHPAGAFDAQVRTAAQNRNRPMWTHSGISEDGLEYFLLVGRIGTNTNAPLRIDLEFNIWRKRFNRAKGAAFVKDQMGRPYLAHRGIVTKGRARVRKDTLFSLLKGVRPIVATSSDGLRQTSLLPVAPLDDEKLVEKVARFAGLVRDAANMAALQTKAPDVRPKTRDKHTGTASGFDIKLRTFRDEFSGTSKTAARSSRSISWKHGSIVSALRDALIDRGETLNCKAIDLAIQHRSRIEIFEVKTSSRSQSIYTAIGQLIFNGAFLQKQFPSHKLTRFLVLPRSNKRDVRQDLCREFGFELITFQANADGYEFHNLPASSSQR